MTEAATGIAVWDDDPYGAVLESPPAANQPVQRPEPDLDPPALKVGIAGAQPQPGGGAA